MSAARPPQGGLDSSDDWQHNAPLRHVTHSGGYITLRHAFTAVRFTVAIGAAAFLAYCAVQALAPLAKVVGAIAGVTTP